MSDDSSYWPIVRWSGPFAIAEPRPDASALRRIVVDALETLGFESVSGSAISLFGDVRLEARASSDAADLRLLASRPWAHLGIPIGLLVADRLAPLIDVTIGSGDRASPFVDASFPKVPASVSFLGSSASRWLRVAELAVRVHRARSWSRRERAGRHEITAVLDDGKRIGILEDRELETFSDLLERLRGFGEPT